MEFVILAALLGIIPGMIASNKGRDFAPWWIYGSLLFLIALPHALLLTATPKSTEAAGLAIGLRKCPYCAELIKPEAIVCRFCGRDVPVLPKRVNFSSPAFYKGQTIDVLVASLRSPIADVREHAVIELGDRRAAAAAAVAPLEDLLHDPVHSIRVRTAWALEQIRGSLRV